MRTLTEEKHRDRLLLATASAFLGGLSLIVIGCVVYVWVTLHWLGIIVAVTGIVSLTASLALTFTQIVKELW